MTVAEGQKEERRMVNREVDKFKWHEVVSGHYRYRGAADNQNDLMRDGVTKPLCIFNDQKQLHAT